MFFHITILMYWSMDKFGEGSWPIFDHHMQYIFTYLLLFHLNVNLFESCHHSFLYINYWPRKKNSRFNCKFLLWVTMISIVVSIAMSFPSPARFSMIRLQHTWQSNYSLVFINVFTFSIYLSWMCVHKNKVTQLTFIIQIACATWRKCSR